MVVLECFADGFAVDLYRLLRAEVYTTQAPSAMITDDGKWFIPLSLGQHYIPLRADFGTNTATDALVWIDLRSGHLRYLGL